MNKIYRPLNSPATTDPTDGPRSRNRSRTLLFILLAVALIYVAVTLDRAWQATRLRKAYLPQLEEMAKVDPTNGKTLTVLGARLAQAGDYKEAAKTLEQAFQSGDSDPLLWLTWAAAESASGGPLRGLGALELGIQKYQIAGLEGAVDRLRRMGATADRMDAARAISPDGVLPLIASRTQGSFLNPIVEWWGRNHPAQSGFATRAQWAMEAPSNSEALRWWGEALTINRAYPQGEEPLQRAVALAPHSLDAHLSLARLLTLEGREAAAIPEYKLCLQIQPGCPPALAALAKLAGGKGSPSFVDVTHPAGLNYRWTIEGKSPHNILQTIGNGCALLDYNNDGNLDILLVGKKLALYRGDGHGRFTDVTQAAGLNKLSGHFLGCAVGDYDNDGYEDLYISAYRGGVLLHNEHGARFRDVTREAGIQSQPWGASCAFADINNDGKLDLYIGCYLQFGPETQPQLCGSGYAKGACNPNVYRAERGVLYLNTGSGHFQDFTKEWQAQRTAGKTLGAAFANFDGSGRESLALANDGEPGDLFRNRGARFENAGISSGTAYDGEGKVHVGMGIDWGDYDNDGRLDLAVATFPQEAKCIYHNDGAGAFTESSGPLGITPRTLRRLTFGIKWFDYDNDGWLDLALTNGHIQDNIEAIDNTQKYRQPPQLFHNLKGSSFAEVSANAGESFQREIVGRGLAVGDFDNDGRVDMLIVDSDGDSLLLHNETRDTGHWLCFRLTGTKSNRDAIGSLVTITAGGITQVRRCGTDGSYLSASDRRVHAGLGRADTADTVTVHWPSGLTTTLHNVLADRIVILTEGTS